MKLAPLVLALSLNTLSFAKADSESIKTFTQRASEIDPRSMSYEPINYLLEKPDGSPADLQVAQVDHKNQEAGKLVIWMMAHKPNLAKMVNGYGMHYMQPRYANQWFSKVCQEKPVGEHCRGNMRLEAATGDDYSDQAQIESPDGMMERVRQYLIWLAKEDRKGDWDQFLSKDQSKVLWSKVIMSGASHGASTSARFAIHQEVDRVVLFCGPRDNFQSWHSLESATPKERFFAFSHDLDGGWTADHYCRSWELMGLNEFGPIVSVDGAEPPYQNTRRLLSSAKVDDKNHAHQVVTPRDYSKALKNEDGTFLYQDVWDYMFTHPVAEVGTAVDLDPGCDKDQR